jgi:hypothetical protein
MEIKYFDEYILNEKLGLKMKTKEYVRKFINSFENDCEKEQWTFQYLPILVKKNSGIIRMELFEEIIFPILLHGYNNKIIDSMVWLVKVSENYYRNNRFWERMYYKSDLEIIKECYSMAPNNEEIQDIYLELEIRSIDYSLHEWPCGILMSNCAATLEECNEMKMGIPKLKKLNRNKKCREYLMNYEHTLNEYIERFSQPR